VCTLDDHVAINWKCEGTERERWKRQRERGQCHSGTCVTKTKLQALIVSGMQCRWNYKKLTACKDSCALGKSQKVMISTYIWTTWRNNILALLGGPKNCFYEC